MPGGPLRRTALSLEERSMMIRKLSSVAMMLLIIVVVWGAIDLDQRRRAESRMTTALERKWDWSVKDSDLLRADLYATPPAVNASCDSLLVLIGESEDRTIIDWSRSLSRGSSRPICSVFVEFGPPIHSPLGSAATVADVDLFRAVTGVRAIPTAVLITRGEVKCVSVGEPGDEFRDRCLASLGEVTARPMISRSRSVPLNRASSRRLE